MPTSQNHSFAAPLVHDPGIGAGYMQHYIPIPDDVAQELRAAGVRRVVGEANGVRFRRALQRDADGVTCVRFGRGWLKDNGLHPGDPLSVSLSEDTDPDGVDLPPELATLIAAEPELAAAWSELTPGKRRTLVYPVTRAKRPETRTKRAQAVVHQVMEQARRVI